MIITRLLGGLGNQMFQYAAGLALAHARRTVLKLDVSWFREYAEFESHNRYGLDCFNVSEVLATREEIDRVKGRALTTAERWSVVVAQRLRFYRYAESLSSRGASFGHPRIPRSPGFSPDVKYSGQLSRFRWPGNRLTARFQSSEQKTLRG